MIGQSVSGGGGGQSTLGAGLLLSPLRAPFCEFGQVYTFSLRAVLAMLGESDKAMNENSLKTSVTAVQKR